MASQNISLNSRECEFDIIIPGISVDVINRAKKCVILNGKISISYISDKWCDIQFPLLKEVTKYVLFSFLNCGANDLNILPNLTVIRGQELIYGYSLVVYRTTFRQLNFWKLQINLRGDILISMNPYLCHINTIDWDFINDNFYRGINKTQGSRKIIMKSNRFVCSTYCSPSCPRVVLNGQNTRLCWSPNHCQLACSNNCTDRGLFCHVSNHNLCCHKECLGGCYGASEYNCISCRHFIHNGTCISKCPTGYFGIDNRCCATLEYCTAKNLSVIYTQQRCVITCPTGLVAFKSNNSSVMHCVNSSAESGSPSKHCGTLFLKSTKDINQATNCYSAERVIIRLQVGGRDVFNRLKEAFKELKVVINFVQVMRSNHLESLSFLNPLTTIKGQSTVDNNGVALHISANNALSHLWKPNSQFSIGRGSIRILANRNLCKKDILRFVGAIRGLSTSQYDKELIEATNGDIAICTVVHLKVSVLEVKSKHIKVTWLERRSNSSYQILNMITYFRQVTKGSTIINGNSSRYSYKGCSSNRWTVVESNCSYKTGGKKLLSSSHWPNDKDSEIICELSSLTPATYYELYLEFRFEGQNAAAISNRVAAVTSTEMPSMPQMFHGVSLTQNKMQLSWSPPLQPNGDIVKYIIRYRPTKTLIENEYINQDFCNSSESNKNAKQSSKPSVPINACWSCAMCKKACFRSPAEEDELLEMTNFDLHIHTLLFSQRKQNDSTKETTSSNNKPLGVLAVSNITEKVIKSDQKYSTHNSTKPLSSTTNVTSRKTITMISKTIDTDIKVVNKYQQKYFHTIDGLEYFSEYRFGIVACHEAPVPGNYSQDVLGRMLAVMCSNEAVITLRTLSNIAADSIPVFGNGSYFAMQPVKKGLKISWQVPMNPNGIVLLFRLRYRIDSLIASWNDQCVDSKKSMLVFRNSRNNNSRYTTVSIVENTILDLHRSGMYQFQIMVVSLAGNGSWSPLETYYFQNAEEFVRNVSLGIASVFLVIIVCSIFAAILVWKKKQQYLRTTNIDFMYTGHDEWNVCIQDIQIISPIGKGNFGMVYSGNLAKLETPAKNIIHAETFPLKVAIKTITQPSSGDDINEFLSEASLMKELQGYHLVHLLGIYSGNINNGGGSLPLAVIELMETGDLRTYLHILADESDEGVIDGQQSLLWSIQIADGMCYLASKRLVHRDLAARNCLVDGNLNIKIGDFGLTRTTNENYYYRKKGRAKMPVRWMAPESLKSAFFTTKSDVWSYGVVLYEMATMGGLPYSGMSHEEVIDFVTTEGKLDHEDLKLPSALLDVMVWCWSYVDSGRPSFMQLLEYLVPYISNEEFTRVSFFNNGFSPLDRCCNCVNEPVPSGPSESAHSDLELTSLCHHVFRCTCAGSMSLCEFCSTRHHGVDNGDTENQTLSAPEIVKQFNNC